MNYKILTGFRATDKDFNEGDVASKADLGSSFGVAFANGWIAAHDPKAPEPESDELKFEAPVREFKGKR